MMMNVFVVYDSAVKAYMQPFFARSPGEALRIFTGACNEDNSQFKKYPADYTLFMLGEYDDQGGVFSTHTPTRVISALEVVESSGPEVVAAPNGRGERRVIL